jgi:hypothetical protein
MCRMAYLCSPTRNSGGKRVNRPGTGCRARKTYSHFCCYPHNVPTKSNMHPFSPPLGQLTQKFVLLLNRFDLGQICSHGCYLWAPSESQATPEGLLRAAFSPRPIQQPAWGRIKCLSAAESELVLRSGVGAEILVGPGVGVSALGQVTHVPELYGPACGGRRFQASTDRSRAIRQLQARL